MAQNENFTSSSNQYDPTESPKKQYINPIGMAQTETRPYITNALANALYDERHALIIYIAAKLKSEDWHAVADAAMDLREIDAKLSVLKD